MYSITISHLHHPRAEAIGLMSSASLYKKYQESNHASCICDWFCRWYQALSRIRGESTMLMLKAAKPIAEIFVLGVVAGFNWAKQKLNS
jgi:hypothetical protein